MPNFKYIARDQRGQRIEDRISAPNADAATAALRRLNLTALSVTEDKGGLSALMNFQIGGKKAPKARVSSGDLVIFTRQFATMIGAGLPVMECLDILAEQADDPGFKASLYKICSDVRTGTDLSSALGRHPRVFSNIYVNMIRAGEASGQLDTILVRLADYMEATESLKRKIKSAMTYPCISLLMIFAITAFLLIFIIPKFEKIFSDMGVSLPLPTKIVLGVSNTVSDPIFMGAFLAVVVGLVVAIVMLKRTKKGRYLWDTMMLKLPVFGGLLQKVAISRFSRTFATLLRSGVAILGALEIVASTSGNAVVEEAVGASREAIRQGEPLAKPLADTPIFPPMVVRMIRVGETSGSLEVLLEKISEFYDEQVDATVESLTSLIEPMLIGVMGFVVGGIVLSIFMPIFKMQEALSG
jgi:type IV pilus assembly protein PilC